MIIIIIFAKITQINVYFKHKTYYKDIKIIKPSYNTVTHNISSLVNNMNIHRHNFSVIRNHQCVFIRARLICDSTSCGSYSHYHSCLSLFLVYNCFTSIIRFNDFLLHLYFQRKGKKISLPMLFMRISTLKINHCLSVLERYSRCNT